MLNPLMLIRIGAAIALCLALAWVHHIVYQSGYDASDAKWSKMKVDEDKKALDKERLMQSYADSISATSQKEMEKKNVQIENLKHDVRAGTLRLSVLVHSNKNAGAGTTSKPEGAERAELMPEIAESLVGIATAGDNALRERNECIKLYNSVKVKINE